MWIALFMGINVFATDLEGLAINEVRQVTDVNAKREVSSSQTVAEEIQGVKGEPLTLAEAIKEGLEKSITLQVVDHTNDIAHLADQHSIDTRTEIYDNLGKLEDSLEALTSSKETYYDQVINLDYAQAALDDGTAPKACTIEVKELGVSIQFNQGDVIRQSIENQLVGQPDAVINMVYQKVVEGMQAEIQKLSDQLTKGQEQLDLNTQKYVTSRTTYDIAVDFAMTKVSNKLGLSTISSIHPQPLAQLLVEMCSNQAEVTAYAVDIYRNQIALLIQNNYYEALKQQKLLELKEQAVKRGELQYEYAQYAYDVGAKSKDDLILAKTYYESTKMSRELQVKDYQNALMTLKKSMNTALDREIYLVEVPVREKKDYDLGVGISSALRTNLDVKTAEAHRSIYDELIVALEASSYDKASNQYEEAELLLEKAKLGVHNARLEAESSVRSSYTTMNTMRKVAEMSEELVKNAEETVEIAKIKYEIGFGYDNALLKQMNLEDVSGTMVELLAAEENLITVKEKQIEAINGYNLATAKYLNDIGVMIY